MNVEIAPRSQTSTKTEPEPKLYIVSRNVSQFQELEGAHLG